MGEKEAAIRHFEEVAALDYGYRDVAQRLDQLVSGGAQAED